MAIKNAPTIYHRFEDFMLPGDAAILRDAGLVTVTMLMEGNMKDVAERTGLREDWLNELQNRSFTRSEWTSANNANRQSSFKIYAVSN